MRIFRDRQCIVNTYLTTGDAWRVAWHEGRNGFTVILSTRRGRRGQWGEVYESRCSGAGRMDYALILACAAYPGSDDDGNELPHPAAAFPGLLDDLARAESYLQEKADKR